VHTPLERIALHQTRLRLPGLALDPSGVALGSKGLVLLPTPERLVAFLAIYTRERSFADLLASPSDRVEILVVRSALGTREIVVVLPAVSTTLLDVVADVARLAGGSVFTGSGRHWVQYRDRSAPFGYDVIELLRVDDAMDFALHHSAFTQAYAREREVDLATMVARLEPRPDPSVTARTARPLWLTVESGVAPALVGYLARAGVEAFVGIAELPPASAVDEGPRQLAVVRIDELPRRMERLVTGTPGITAFATAGPGVVVEIGFRHPIGLMGLPVFPADGLAFLPRPGPRRAPLRLDRLPAMAPVAAMVDVRLGDGAVERAVPIAPQQRVAVPLQLAPSVGAARGVSASLVRLEQAPVLRRLAYALPPSTLEGASIARVSLPRAPEGEREVLVLRARPGDGIDAVPLGAFFSERAPGLFVLAGHDLTPACPPDHLSRALGAAPEQPVFVFREPGDAHAAVRAFAIPATAFVSLATALVEPEGWGALEPIEVRELARVELEAPLRTIEMGSIGMLPMRHVEPPPR
jgi:hypothetical protein